MSKVFNSFKGWVLEGDRFPKLFSNHSPGPRILPANTATENAKHELRIDAGEVKDGKKNLYLQANSQAKNTAIKKYISRNGTHANIATTQIDMDTPKEKQEEEAIRAMKDFQNGFFSKIG
jgi:hypothetical protein